MKVKITLLLLIGLLATGLVRGQVAKDATVPIAAVINQNPLSITLNWPNPSASTLNIYRRIKGQAGIQWVLLHYATASTETSFTDNNITPGQTYEYSIQRTTNINAYGYVMVAAGAPVVDQRGKVLLFVDADLLAPLSAELERLRNDLAGDGWQVIEHVVDAAATVQTVKNQIVADYNSSPSTVKSVFLLGKIPVPYSGNTNWDGHPDHQGAWPADSYYGDVNGTWTDVNVNNTSPSRPANDNVPGDGKFDQSIIPSPVDLPVGRVDLRRLTLGTFGATTAELFKRYLDKDHNWRMGLYTVENKALVDDNFFFFSGEAFAENGFRNAYPLVGEANVVEGDFFNNSNPQSYLMGYGCGGGSYNSAGGVGSSTDFAFDTVNIVFTNLFGSYHGDWDYETNPLMPAALGSRGGILTCSWAGRPHEFSHAMAAGETIGYCMKETQNAQYNNGFFASYGESGAHLALLGDPTLRAHVVAPPDEATVTAGCGAVLLDWKPSPDTAVAGYHIYRSAQQYGVYTRLTTNVLTEISYSDVNPPSGTLFYQVRAVKEQSSPGGGIYWNSSTGKIISVVASSPMEVQIQPGAFDCAGGFSAAVVAQGGTPPYQYLWSNGDTLPTAVFPPGSVNYSITVTDSGVCNYESPEITINQPLPLNISASVTDESAPGANDGSVQLTVQGGAPPFTYLWSTGATGDQLENVGDGIYTVTVTDAAGCTHAESFEVKTTSAVNETALLEQLSLTPNPTSGQALLRVQLKRAASFHLEVRDITGRLIFESPEMHSAAATITIDLRGNPPGMYNLQVRINGEVVARKLVVER